MLYLEDVPTEAVVKVEAFRRRLWKPIRAWLEATGRLERTDLLAWSTGFPYGVDFTEEAQAKGVAMSPPLSPTASLTSMTYLWRHVEAEDPAKYLDLQVNGYFRRPDDGRGEPPRDPTEAERAVEREAEDALQAKEWEKAAAAYERLFATFPENFRARYNHACCLAKLGRKEDALAALRKSVEHGWSNAAYTEGDEDLAALRGEAAFRELLDAMRGRRVSWQPTRGFRSRYAWSGAAAPETDGVEDSRDRYLLSVMLGYTGPNGSKAEDVLAYLATAARADGKPPQGTFYFLENDDVRANTREPMFPTAIAALRALGLKAETLTKGEGGQDGVLPCAKDDVAGIVAGIAGFDWSRCGSRILPGALAEHLTSFGAHFGTAGQTKCVRFLEAGAAGTSGTVAEPYAIPHKFPVPYLHVHYARGVSMAEAMYQSVYGPYQLMILGDPLARPFAAFAKVALASPAPAKPWTGTVEVRATLEAAPERPLGTVELWVDGRPVGEAPVGEPIRWDTTTADDGPHDLRLVAVEASPIETRSVATVPVKVHNGARTIKVTAPKGAVAADATVRLAGSAKGCETVEVRQGSRVLGSSPVKGGNWKVEFPASRLGPGTATLQARGSGKDGPGVRSDPFDVAVEGAGGPAEPPKTGKPPRKK